MLCLHPKWLAGIDLENHIYFCKNETNMTIEAEPAGDETFRYELLTY